MFKTRNAWCVLRFKRKRKIANAKIYEDKRDLYCNLDGLGIVGLRILSIRQMVFTLCLILILDPKYVPKIPVWAPQ